MVEPVNLHRKASISVDSTCKNVGADDIKFIVDVDYNGRNIFFTAKQNIDKFGATTGTGSPGQDAYGTADFYHTACRAYRWDKDFALLCTNEYFVTATATVTVDGPTRDVAAVPAGASLEAQNIKNPATPGNEKTTLTTVSADSVTSSTTLDASLVSKSGGYMEQTVKVIFAADCPRGADYLEAKVIASYNGKQISYTGKSNVDYWGMNKSGGGYDKPITDDKQFFHSGCRHAVGFTMCRYDYYGVLDVTVRVHGKSPGIDIGIHGIKDRLAWRKPTVFETCQTFSSKEKMVCPTPSKATPALPCPISGIATKRI
ncbi:protein of unknown function [Taphrina deformans PYCC 5710]|uniref:Uncharacterized protein n=1 Tax=Taphrina deformans (strain PYCC 5710 / ATCC 11124 / CBS 356.35 / IMI 108563 / JCM 9778 / NBRC 8474) TaxID=1097556 RepID=R4XGJ8_TAPDE|nr:protein of unknown function [Taphrina deformans PYCC 5710]|eukprot:CCG84910.1 protein of unknown function [Taphrina deformans PYCC 5710]